MHLLARPEEHTEQHRGRDKYEETRPGAKGRVQHRERTRRGVTCYRGSRRCRCRSSAGATSAGGRINTHCERNVAFHRVAVEAVVAPVAYVLAASAWCGYCRWELELDRGCRLCSYSVEGCDRSTRCGCGAIEYLHTHEHRDNALCKGHRERRWERRQRRTRYWRRACLIDVSGCWGGGTEQRESQHGEQSRGSSNILHTAQPVHHGASSVVEIVVAEEEVVTRLSCSAHGVSSAFMNVRNSCTLQVS